MDVKVEAQTTGRRPPATSASGARAALQPTSESEEAREELRRILTSAPEETSRAEQDLVSTASSPPALPASSPEEIRASVNRIISALKGITTWSGSEAILDEFQGKDATTVRALLEELKRRAPEHGETPEAMVKWLLEDLTAEDRRTLQQLLSQLGVTGDLSPVMAEEVEALLDGVTSASDSHEILSILRGLHGAGLDQLLTVLESRTGLDEEALAAWLFGDLSREDAEHLRRHLFGGGPKAIGYATRFTVSKLESLLSSYTGHADSSSIAWNLETTPEARRAGVLSGLDARTRQRWRQRAEDALMEDLDRSDYERLQKLPGLTLRPYDYKPSPGEQVLSALEWAEIAAEILAGGAVGIVTGVISGLWEVVELAWDVVVAAKHLVMSFFYLASGGLVGSEDWLAVKDFFRGFARLFSEPMAILQAAWEETKLGSETIEGAFAYGRRAEYWTRRVVNFVITVVTIVKAAAKGGQKLAQTVQRMRLVRRMEGAGELLERVRDLGKTERLLGKTRDAGRTQRLLDKVGGDVDRLQALLDKLKSAEDIERLERLLGASAGHDLGRLERLLDAAGGDLTKLEQFLGHTGEDAARLEKLLQELKGAENFQNLAQEVGPRLFKVLAAELDGEVLGQFVQRFGAELKALTPEQVARSLRLFENEGIRSLLAEGLTDKELLRLFQLEELTMRKLFLTLDARAVLGLEARLGQRALDSLMVDLDSAVRLEALLKDLGDDVVKALGDCKVSGMMLRQLQTELGIDGAKKIGQQAKQLSAKTREEVYRLWAKEHEALDQGHSLDRHGPGVSEPALEQRVKTGVTPEGSFSPTKSSTKFKSYEDWVKTREAALRTIEQVHGVDLSKPAPSGMQGGISIIVEHGRSIDEGFIGQGSKVPIFSPKSQTMVNKGYGTTNRIEGLTRTKTTVEWNPAANGGQGRWEVVQHFPWSEDWDDAAKLYTASGQQVFTAR